MYGILAAGYGDWPIIKQIAWLLGKLMDGIYNVMDAIGIQNIGICIIIIDTFAKLLMFVLDPLNKKGWYAR